MNVDVMQFGFTSNREMTDALLVVKRMLEKYKDEKKLHICFMDIDKVFDRAAKNVME